MAKYFPIFKNLENAPVLIFGSGEKAIEKIVKLREYAPHITVADAALSEEITVFSDISIKICKFCDAKELLREISPQLVIIADVPREEIPTLFALCTDQNIPVNTVDRKEYCTFIFPSVIQKKDLTVAISTSGTSPAMAKLLRENIENMIPSEIDSILDWFEKMRPVLRQRSDIKPSMNRELQRELAAFSFRENRPPTEKETEHILKKYQK